LKPDRRRWKGNKHEHSENKPKPKEGNAACPGIITLQRCIYAEGKASAVKPQNGRGFWEMRIIDKRRVAPLTIETKERKKGGKRGS